MKLAANLSWLYTEYYFEDRLAACAQDGFRYAECMFPYDMGAASLASAARAAGVQWVLINAPAGDWGQGERGLAGLPGRQAEFRSGVEQAAEYAQALGVKLVHVLAGVSDANTRATSEHLATYRGNLEWLAGYASQGDITWTIEPINTRDMPGYLLHSQQQAHQLVQDLACPKIAVQMDLYHCAVQEQDALIELLNRYIPTGRVAHVQIADEPGRGEPCSGKVDWTAVFQTLSQLGYGGWIGCEYKPANGTRAGLGWRQRLGF